MHTADHYLLNRWILQRDAQAFKELMTKYSAMVFGTSVRILRNAADAEEVTQECFAALANSKQGPQGSMGAWLHRIATNQALNRRRTELRRSAREDRFAKASDESIEIKWCDISEHIDEAIERLPEGIRTAIIGHFFEDETVTQIAARECVTHGAISQRIQKGVALIREHLRQKGIAAQVLVLSALLAEHAAAWAPVPPRVTASLARLALAGGRPPTTGMARKTLGAGKLLVGAAAALLATSIAVGLMRNPQVQPVAAAQFTPPQTPPATHAISPVVTSSDEAGALPAQLANTPDGPAGGISAAEEAKTPPKSWRELVAAYTAHQNRIRRISFDYEHATEGNYDYSLSGPGAGHRAFYERGSFITDGERCSMRHLQWGEEYSGETRTESQANFATLAFDGTAYISYIGGPTDGPPGLIDMHPNARQSPIADSAFRNGRTYLLFARYPGGAMLGLPLPNGWRMEEFLSSARRVALRPSKETIGTSECYVLDADLDYGDFTVWFDPERHYNIAQSVIHVSPGDIHEVAPLINNASVVYTYRADSFVQVNGLWVPETSTSRQTSSFLAGQGHDYLHTHKRSAIRLLAPGEDMHAYKIAAEDIPNDATLLEFGVIVRSGDPRWRWRDDRFVFTTEAGERKPRGDRTLGKGFGGGMIMDSIYE